MNKQERLMAIEKILKTNEQPITGQELSEKFGVSRQIIVSDIAALRAEDNDIISTKDGYYYQGERSKGERFKRKIRVYHTLEQMEEEVRLIVENGAVIDNVSVVHPIYGEITVELMLTSVEDCNQFTHDMERDNAKMLAELTGNHHLHVISAKTEKILDNAIEDLRRNGFLDE